MPRSSRAANGKANGKKSNGRPEKLHAAYDAFKEHEGKRYTGMKVGRGHKWQYDPGEWVEKKVTPDKWEIRYAVNKRRRGKAPEGSGVPVGTAYHWYILAHQCVTKLDANTYSTEMVGIKYKLAHRRADKDAWNASESAQKKRLIKVLKDTIAALEADSEQGEAALPHAKSQPRKAKSRAKARSAKAKRPQTAARRDLHAA